MRIVTFARLILSNKINLIVFSAPIKVFLIS